MHIEKKTLRNVFIGVIACIVVYWLLNASAQVKSVVNIIKGIVSPFVLGAGLAFVLNVPMRSIEGWLKGIKHANARRLLAMLLTFLGLLLIITLVFLLLIPQLSSTVQSLLPKLTAFLNNVETKGREFLQQNPQVMQWLFDNTDLENLNWAELAQKGLSMVGESVSTIFSSAISAIGSVTGALINLVIGVVFSIYCLFQKETLARQGRKLLYAFLPEKFCDQTVRILRLTNSTFSNFLAGQCVEVCILGTLFAISMAIFRMPYIPLVSVLVAVTAFIPMVGAWVGCIFGAFLILVANPLQAVWFVIMFVVLQQIENNLIYPRVVGTSIGLSGMWVLVAVAIGGELMGVAGMFLMIPVASVLQTLLRETTNQKLGMKEIAKEKLEPQPPDLISRIKAKRKKKENNPESK